MDFDKKDIVLANLLFPDVTEDVSYLEEKYPKREKNGGTVTRIGPSPTGFVHLGNIYNALIAERIAHTGNTNGTFFLRIEDTDAKRKVDGAVDLIISSMKYFGIEFDEGATETGDDGKYGPYRQSERKDIYHIVAKLLVKMGRAYPCFCTEEELEAMRESQKEQKIDFGYYGKYAKCANLSIDEIKENIDSGKPYVLRFKSHGTAGKYFEIKDGIRGKLKLQQNYMDAVLLKSDGIPTYHFAHVVDDHFMHTTHVVRGEEWLSTLPLHVELFRTLGWDTPVYCHTATLMKMDGASKRKLSKRKDPEMSLQYYVDEGYAVDAVWNYMLTLMDSHYEEWCLRNPDITDPRNYLFEIKNLSCSGALVDMDKFHDVCKTTIAKKTWQQVADELFAWAKEHNEEYYDILTKDTEKTQKALMLGRGGKKPRKDIVTWKQSFDYMKMFFDETFEVEDKFPESIPQNLRKDFLKKYLEVFDITDDNETWFEKVKKLCDEMGLASNMKEYKANPESFAGSIVDATNIIRIALTGRQNAPDILEVSKVLGLESVKSRLENAILR